MIWIRADANREIGAGHIMRCLSIAEALEALGAQTCFLVADGGAVPLLERRSQRYRVLNSDYTMPEEETEQIEVLTQEEDNNFFLADSYFVTDLYLKRIKAGMPVGYIDDMCRPIFSADLIINYNIFARHAMYKAFHSKQLLIGPAYVPLRREFSAADYVVRQEASKVLVTTGGSDPYNLAGRFVEKALADPRTAEMEYRVVSGAYNSHLHRLTELSKNHANVRICRNVDNMAELMQECDTAVTAGGSTMYELSAVGVPIVCFSFVKNQERIVEEFRNQNLVCFGGNYLEQGDSMLDKALEAMALAMHDAEARLHYSRRLKDLADGHGAERIARALEGFCNL